MHLKNRFLFLLKWLTLFLLLRVEILEFPIQKILIKVQLEKRGWFKGKPPFWRTKATSCNGSSLSRKPCALILDKATSALDKDTE